MKKFAYICLILAFAFIQSFAADRKIALQTYSFADLPLDELVPVLKELGIDTLGCSGGLKISNKYPNVRFNNGMTKEQRDYVKKILKDNNLKIASYGVVYSKTEKDVENLCKFAREFNCPAIITEDAPSQFPFWEKYCDIYGVKMAIHNHATNVKNNYYNPEYVHSLIKDYKNIYSCADNGHWARSGVDTIKGHNILKGKLLVIHLKDTNKFGDLSGTCRPFGEGVLNMKEVLKNLDKQGYDSYFVIEYEGAKNPVEQVKKCVEFLKNN